MTGKIYSVIYLAVNWVPGGMRLWDHIDRYSFAEIYALNIPCFCREKRQSACRCAQTLAGRGRYGKVYFLVFESAILFFWLDIV
jgi:hypothetical protein